MRKSWISPDKQKKLTEHFAVGATARCAAALVGVHRNTAAYCFQRLSELITHQMTQESLEVFDGDIAVDKSYLGGERKGKRGQGAAGKVPVLGF